MKRTILPFLLLALLAAARPGLAEELRYAFFPAPPFMIASAAEGGEPGGIDADIVREMARRLGLTVVFKSCTWQRCLSLLQEGQADILTSAFRTPEREKFLAYLDRPYLDRLPISFYLRKGDNRTIRRYEDLADLSIGVLRGANYFARFDADAALDKQAVSSQDQLFPMLAGGRLDAVAGYVPTENYRLTVEGFADRIVKSPYEHDDGAKVFMALGRKSPLAGRLADFNRVNRELLDEGIVSGIVGSYYRKYDAPR